MTQLKILKYLIANNDRAFTINEISKNLQISYKIVYEIIQRLKNEDLISLNKVGNSSQVQFNFNFNQKIIDAELQRREDVIKDKNLMILTKRFQEINSPFFIAILFGSYAKGKQTKSSDIDICIICDNKDITKEINNKISLLPLDLHIIDFTSKEFLDMLKTTDFNVGHEIKKNNIILHGIENYYNLIKNPV